MGSREMLSKFVPRKVGQYPGNAAGMPSPLTSFPASTGLAAPPSSLPGARSVPGTRRDNGLPELRANQATSITPAIAPQMTGIQRSLLADRNSLINQWLSLDVEIHIDGHRHRDCAGRRR